MRVFAPAIGVIAGVLAVVFIFLALVAGTGYNTQPDQVALHYKGGPWSNTEFAQCIDPSDRDLIVGVADEIVYYPSQQRTYEFSTAKTADTSEITVLTKDNIELSVNGVLRFSLNTDCKTLRAFHETIGRKFGAKMDGDETSEGWRNMLRTYVRQALQRSVNEATQNLNWKQLYNDTSVRKEWETTVNKSLPSYVKQAMGGDYFDEFSLTVQKPKLPDEIVKALRDTQVAVEQNNAQKARNEQVQTELDSIKELVDVLGPDAYNVYQGIKDGKVQIIPVPQGSSVVVNP